MSIRGQEVFTDTLFVALTRPATVMGIPYTAFIAEVMIVGIVFLAVNNPLYLLLAVPVHLCLYAISATDPAALNSLPLWIKTNGRCRNIKFWGAASFSPLPTKKWLE